MTEFVRTVVHTFDPESGHLITLVPVVDYQVPNPITKEFVESIMTNGQWVILETTVFNNLMNLGVSPIWTLDTRQQKPIVWNSNAERHYFIARLVADCRADETVSVIDGNKMNLRYYNIEKTKKQYDPDKKDRGDFVKSDYVIPWKSVSTYTNYGAV